MNIYDKRKVGYNSIAEIEEEKEKIETVIPMNEDHIKLEANSLTCANCGTVKQITFPMNAKKYFTMGLAFCQVHRECSEPSFVHPATGMIGNGINY